MRTLLLTGPDGKNPLGFLCSLGVLRVLAQRHPKISLSFVQEGTFRPVLHLPDASIDPVVEVMSDLNTWKGRPAELDLRYVRKGKKGEKWVYDLKPEKSSRIFRDFLERAAISAARGQPRHAAFASAFGSDVVADNNGNIKPTALHFTAGQQTFLEMVHALAEGVESDLISEALFGPWRNQDEIAVLRWDADGERLHALSAEAPNESKPRGVAGANWLAFQALPLFPCFPEIRGSRHRLSTASIQAGAEEALVWPLWKDPISLDTVRSLLSGLCLALCEMDARQRLSWQSARGITCVVRATIRRSDHGYGSFSPASVI